MKILLLLAFVIITPLCLKAQGTTLGQSRSEFRASIKPNGGITLLKGEVADTVVLQAGAQMVMYYKNDTCYASRATMPMKYKGYLIKKMTDDSYQKVNATTWIDRTKTIKVVVTDSSDKQHFTVVDTWWDAGKN